MFKVIANKAPDISDKRMKELLLFCKTNNLKFHDISLLENALTHSSFANEAKDPKIKDNERLEFLGDSVLSLAISKWLYENMNVNEGECTRIRSFVVSEDALSKVALNLSLDKLILMGKGEEQTGGRHKKAILADCTEAVFAAVFIDRGFEAARQFILSQLMDEIKLVLENRHHKDYKTMLQEYVQKKYKIVPTYTLVRTEGPEHNQLFYYSVEFNNKVFGPESGHNKKDAEQNVAQLACKQLGL